MTTGHWTVNTDDKLVFKFIEFVLKIWCTIHWNSLLVVLFSFSTRNGLFIDFSNSICNSSTSFKACSSMVSLSLCLFISLASRNPSRFYLNSFLVGYRYNHTHIHSLHNDIQTQRCISEWNLHFYIKIWIEPFEYNILGNFGIYRLNLLSLTWCNFMNFKWSDGNQCKNSIFIHSVSILLKIQITTIRWRTVNSD